MPPFVVEKLRDDAKLPTRANKDDAGLDLYAATDIIMQPSSTVVIPTGISIDIPKYSAGLILPRSGLAAKGITVMNSPGLIDSGYTGEVRVILYNSNKNLWYVHKGDRIAQLLIMDMLRYYPLEGKIDKSTERGQDGFGSTGV